MQQYIVYFSFAKKRYSKFLTEKEDFMANCSLTDPGVAGLSDFALCPESPEAI